MLSLKANMKKVGDFHEIQNFIDNANAEVLVGYLAGKYHQETLHRDDTDRPNAKRKGSYTGYNGETNPQDNQPIELAELAKTLSFGAHGIPPRPFIEEGLLSEKDNLKKEVETQLENIKNGKAANWNKVGTKAVGAVQDFVRGDYYKSTVPNSPKTVAYKGSDTPLIDGGDLINSLEYVVTQGGN
jgi:hypothetical protein